MGGAALVAVRVVAGVGAADGADICTGGAPGGGGATLGWRFSWSYLHEILSKFCPLQLLAHTLAGGLHSDIDWMKTDDEDAALAAWFCGRARATESTKSTGFLLLVPVLPTAFAAVQPARW